MQFKNLTEIRAESGAPSAVLMTIARECRIDHARRGNMVVFSLPAAARLIAIYRERHAPFLSAGQTANRPRVLRGAVAVVATATATAPDGVPTADD